MSLPTPRRVAALVMAFLVAIALGSVAAVANARDAVTWERSVLVGDTLTVPVRWTAVCDDLGCPDAFRVTWTSGDPVTVVPAPSVPRTGGMTDTRVVPPVGAPPVGAPPTDGAGVPVLRDVTTRVARDSIRIAVPALGKPQTVCVSVVAMRRGIASSARRGCRTVERSDAAPQPVDSITWDSVETVHPHTDAILNDSMGDTLALVFGQWSRKFMDTLPGPDSILTPREPQPRVRDPETGLVLVPANRTLVRVGYEVQMCAMVLHRSLPLGYVDVPAVLFQSPAKVRRFQAECRSGLALDWPGLEVRWLSYAVPGAHHSPYKGFTDTLRPVAPPLPSRRGA